MHSRLIEATNVRGGGINWGKFLLGRFEHKEWLIQSAVMDGGKVKLLRSIGYDRAQPPLLVLDLQTREGALFYPKRSSPVQADLTKHRIWVCPLFEPFLAWLYKQDLGDLDALPALVNLDNAPSAFQGYRRPGPKEARP